MPRTYIIPDDVVPELEQAAAERHTSVDDFVYSALRKALPLRIVTNPISGLPMFDVPADTPIFTSEDVRRAEDDE